MRALPALALLALCSACRTAAPPRPLESIAQVRALPPATLAKAWPVHLQATVTAADPRWNLLAVTHDGHGLGLQLTRAAHDLHPGDQVTLDAFTSFEGSTPFLVKPRLRRTGQASPGPAQPVTLDDLLARRLDYQWVQLDCTIDAARVVDLLHWEIDAHAAGRPFRVMSSNLIRPSWTDLLGKRVRLRGVPLVNYSPSGEPLSLRFFLSGQQNVTPLEPLSTLGSTFADATADPTAPTLRSVAAVKALSNRDAARHYPVRLQAVVTVAGAGHLRNFTVQDAGTGLYVEYPVAGATAIPGDLVEVEGLTQRGGYAPVVKATRIARLGHPGLPAPKSVRPAEGFADADENAYVEVEGLVRRTSTVNDLGSLLELYAGPTLLMGSFGHTEPAGRLAALRGKRVRLRGTMGPSFSSDEALTGAMIYLAGPTPLEVLGDAPGDSMDSPPRSVHELLEYRPGRRGLELVKLHGRVVYGSDAGYAYLADSTGGIRLEGGAWQTGESVEVVGVPSLGRPRVGLEALEWRKAAAVPEPPPEHVAVETSNFGVYDGRLVTLEAYVSGRDSHLGDQILTVRAGRQEFQAVLGDPRPTNDWADLREGALVRLTGVCQIGWDETVMPAEPASLRILLRSAADARILRRAPWWTLERVRWILGLTLATTLLILLWVFALRRRVSAQLREQAELESRLSQAQKMESIGRLAGGMAHDFNNILTVITGYSQLLIMKLAGQPLLHGYAEQVLKAGERAAALTQQLLAFSRHQRLEPVVFDLNALVAEMDRMLRRLIGENIEMALTLAEGQQLVRADQSQISQVIMNLAVNARDAMPEGGRLEFATRRTELTEPDADVTPGQYIELAVTDTGTGMDAETMKRIFEPFFTTKARGQGTGLGLATVFGIVKQSGGHVTVESAPGRGTSFRVYLPASECDEPAVRQAQAESKVPGGREQVLVVEDQAEVRGVVAETLGRLGYGVRVKTSADEALALPAEELAGIDLLLTDLSMPGMTGERLADEMKKIRAGLRVLYMSGYSEIEVPRSDFLQKPFTPETLAARVREVLDRRR